MVGSILSNNLPRLMKAGMMKTGMLSATRS